MKGAVAAVLLAGAAAVAVGADQATMELGKKTEQTSCVPCHSLRLVESQRLSRAAWDKELTKMAGWGFTAQPEARAALLEYLVANFGDDKPAPPPERSADGRK